MSDPQQTYETLIGPLRAKARELGYAIGVHGSLARDIDLIACPWTEDAVPEPELAEALRKAAENACGSAVLGWNMRGREYTLAGCPGGKPHGRLGWVFWCDGVPIDMSVMPRITGEKT